MLDVTPDPPMSAAQHADRAVRLEQDRIESAFLSHMAGTDRMDGIQSSSRRRTPRGSRTARVLDRCSAAKEKRETVLRSVGLARTFDLLRKLDGDVAAACD
jgi:hypothetical protein